MTKKKKPKTNLLTLQLSVTSTAADRFAAVENEMGVQKAAPPVPLSSAPACDVVSPTRRTRTRASWWSRGRTGASEPRPFVGPGCASYRWLWKDTKRHKAQSHKGAFEKVISECGVLFRLFISKPDNFFSPASLGVIQHELSKRSLLLTDESWLDFSTNHFQ